MKRLLLLRHAKARREAPAGGDHARALAPRGRAAAAKIGDTLRTGDWLPDFVICSDAKRTVETLEIALAGLGHRPEVVFEPRAYLADWPLLLELLRAAPGSARNVMLVGHNPGMEQLAAALARPPKGTSERAAARHLADKFPTAALAVLEFTVKDWKRLAPATGRIADFVCPRDAD